MATISDERVVQLLAEVATEQENAIADAEADQNPQLAIDAVGEFDLAEMRSIITELQSLRSQAGVSEAVAFQLSPLKWEGDEAKTPFGSYKVERTDDGYAALFGFDEIAHVGFNAVDIFPGARIAAQKHAEADWRARISSLSFSAQKPVGWLSRGHGAVIVFTVHPFMRDEWAAKGMEITPLYARPAPIEITEEMVERAAKAILYDRFGNDADAFFEPVPDAFPDAADARRLFARRIAEATSEVRAALTAALQGETK